MRKGAHRDEDERPGLEQPCQCRFDLPRRRHTGREPGAGTRLRRVRPNDTAQNRCAGSAACCMSLMRGGDDCRVRATHSGAGVHVRARRQSGATPARRAGTPQYSRQCAAHAYLVVVAGADVRRLWSMPALLVDWTAVPPAACLASSSAAPPPFCATLQTLPRVCTRRCSRDPLACRSAARPGWPSVTR